MFGKKKASSRTVLLLDIESGSVAGALLHLSQTSQPKLYAHKRVHLPVGMRPAALLTNSLEAALKDIFMHVSLVAARMRVHAPNTKAGEVGEAAVFLAAPWGSPNLVEGKSNFTPGLREYVAQELKSLFGDVPVSFYTSADSIAYAALSMGRAESLLAALRGELIELVHIGDTAPLAYGTAPGGTNSVLRTLQVHDNLTTHEARSRLELLHHHHEKRYEPLFAAARHVTESFADGATLLLQHAPSKNVVVLGEGELAVWFAKNIADESKLGGLFVEGSTIEPLRAHHLLSHAPMQTTVHDPYLLLEALFVDGRDAKAKTGVY